MSFRRLASVTAILLFNLLVGFLYIQPSGLRSFAGNATAPNETGVFPGAEGTAAESPPPGVQQPPFPLLFNFTLNPRELCAPADNRGKGKISLLVLVCSAVPNFEQRAAVRASWGAAAAGNAGFVRLGFVVGTPAAGDAEAVQRRLEAESRAHADLVQQDFVDSYRNLTLKSVALLRWAAEFCPGVQFVMKTDDDMYVNVPNLVRALARFPVRQNVMYGVLFRGARPDRDPRAKWHVPREQFRGDVFPDYLSGTGYVMSRDVVPRLLEAAARLPFLVMEDVFITGLCAGQCRVRRYNVRGFAYWRRAPTGCAFKDALTGHHVTPKEMGKIWEELQGRPLVCRAPKKKG